MRKLLFLLMLLIPIPAHAIHIISQQAKINIKTDKVATLVGEIDNKRWFKFLMDMLGTANIPGPRVIVINSNGGYTTSGDQIIALIEKEKDAGVKMICVVDGEAASMAFNILSHCNVRLATQESRLLFHKIAVDISDRDNVRHTADFYKRLVEELERDDEEYARINRKLLHLTKAQYDFYASKDINWPSRILLAKGYLNGLVQVIE